jgi:acetolactate synthase I/III small subunit
MNSINRVDTQGQLVIPNEFRNILDRREGDEVLLSQVTKTNTLTISSIYNKADNLITIEIELNDKPGSLATLAGTLAKNNIDLVMTESKSFQRGIKVRWYIIADITKCSYGANKIKKTLLQNSSVESVSITKIARDRLHC